MEKYTKRKCIMWIIVSILVIIIITVIAFINQPSFGRIPQGERIERIQKSPNYLDGKFRNINPTQQITSGKPKIYSLINFLFRKLEGLRPETKLPVIKTDLKQFSTDTNVLVWLGHSSLYVQTGGKRILIDPVLIMASPVSFVNTPFNGTDLYKPEDIPDIDYMIITHDHWDHLDYQTVINLKNRIGKVICGLGVGEHFEYWGFDKSRIIELDWNESIPLDNEFIIQCLPSRHFSGRGLSADKTLWVSYLIQTSSGNIYLSGDTGYDTHFTNIYKRFGSIDLAILENGQYNEDWKYIHLMPENLVKAAKDLHTNKLFTIHNSKYALSTHGWKEPLANISKAAAKDSFHLLTPMIGEPVFLKDKSQHFTKWWENTSGI